VPLTDLVHPTCIKVPLEAATRDAAIAELIDLLAAEGALSDPADALAAVLRRETIRSTGLGGGVALPHGKTAAATELLVAVGTCPEGIDFHSPDGRLVRLVVLLVGPKEASPSHIQALARIARFLQDEPVREALLAADGPRALWEMLRRDEQIGTTL